MENQIVSADECVVCSHTDVKKPQMRPHWAHKLALLMMQYLLLPLGGTIPHNNEILHNETASGSGLFCSTVIRWNTRRTPSPLETQVLVFAATDTFWKIKPLKWKRSRVVWKREAAQLLYWYWRDKVNVLTLIRNHHRPLSLLHLLKLASTLIVVLPVIRCVL